MTTRAKKNEKLQKVIEAFKHINGKIEDMNRDPDTGESFGGRSPVADVVITAEPEAGRVVVTYDGAGFDWWSCNAEYQTSFREQFSDALSAIDSELHFEDANSWSLSIHID
jgi:hypothetical protein